MIIRYDHFGDITEISCIKLRKYEKRPTNKQKSYFLNNFWQVQLNLCATELAWSHPNEDFRLRFISFQTSSYM